MKKNKLFAIILSACILSLAACGESPATIAPQGKPQTAESSSQTTIAQTTDPQTETSVKAPDLPAQLPSINVAVIDAKRANITVHANGGEYFGYSLQMFDPLLGEIGTGNYYDVTLSGNECHLLGYRDWNVDYVAGDDVKYEDYGKGDYLFKVILPDSDVISFYTIDEYRLNIRTSADDSTFYSAGNFKYSDVCQFMDEEAATAARNNSSGVAAPVSRLTTSDVERIGEILKSWKGEYQNADWKGLQITGDYGTYQLGTTDRIEIHLYADDKTDLGDDSYIIRASIDIDDIVTIECEGREGHYAAGQTIKMEFSGDRVFITSGGSTYIITRSDKVRDMD